MIILDKSKTQEEFLYDVFISYRHTKPDETVAERLHRALESYKAPRAAVRKANLKQIKKVFRDREELPTSADLSEGIEDALRQSRSLVVICSPRTPESKWVAKEIEKFRDLGRGKAIHALLIEGKPEESFPPMLRFVSRYVTGQSGEKREEMVEIEPLAADIRASNLRQSLRLLKTEKLRLIAPIIGCSFDDLKQRHRERVFKQWVALSTGLFLASSLFGLVYVSKWREAEYQRGRAEAALSAEANQRMLAEGALEEAEEQRAEAERQKVVAEEQRQAALEQKKIAEEQRNIAEVQRNIAEVQTDIARLQRNQAYLNESAALASLSRQQTDSGDATTGALLALEALPKNLDEPERPYSTKAEAALYYALSNLREVGVFQHPEDIEEAGISQDGSTIYALGQKGSIYVWDAKTRQEICTIPENNDLRDSTGNKLTVVRRVFINRNGTRILVDNGSRQIASGTDCWHLWDSRSGKLIARLSQGVNKIREASFSPDGTQFATIAWDDSETWIWDTGKGQPLKKIQGDNGNSICVSFSPEGQTLLVGGGNSRSSIISIDDGKRILDIDIPVNDEVKKHMEIEKANTRYVSKAAEEAASRNLPHIENASFSSDGRRIALIVRWNALDWIYVWDFDENRVIGFIDYGGYGFALSPDGKKIVKENYGDTITLWDIDLNATLDIKGNGLTSFSLDSRYLINSMEGKTRILDSSSGEEVMMLSGHATVVSSAVPYQDEDKQYLLTGGDSTARIWDIGLSREQAQLTGHTSGINSIEFSPDGSRLLTVSYDDTARIWDARTGRELSVLPAHGDLNKSENFYLDVMNFGGKFSPDGRYVATYFEDYLAGEDCARVWDAYSGRQVSMIRLPEGGVELLGVFFTPDSRQLITVDYNNIQLCDIGSGEVLSTIKGDFDTAALSTDGKRLITTDWKMTNDNEAEAQIWDTAGGRQIFTLTGHSDIIRNMTFSPDGRIAATASDDGSVITWDVMTGRRLALMQGHGNMISDVSFSPDGSKIITASLDRTARIWDVETGNEMVILNGHGAVVNTARFSPDGRRVVTSSNDHTAVLWDAESGQRMAVAKGSYKIKSACFSPDGGLIAAASYGGAARLYEMLPGGSDLIKLARGLLTRQELTPEEKKYYLNIDE